MDEPYFDHDLENIDYDAEDFDLALGAPGLHKIRRKVEWIGTPDGSSSGTIPTL